MRERERESTDVGEKSGKRSQRRMTDKKMIRNEESVPTDEMGCATYEETMDRNFHALYPGGRARDLLVDLEKGRRPDTWHSRGPRVRSKVIPGRSSPDGFVFFCVKRSQKSPPAAA